MTEQPNLFGAAMWTIQLPNGYTLQRAWETRAQARRFAAILRDGYAWAKVVRAKVVTK